MTYEKAKEYLENVSSFGIELGLKRMKCLCDKLNHPEKSLKFVHIAGTNGKGSTAAFISSILGNAGIRVGRFVSPVVFVYEECIQYEDATGIYHISKEMLKEIVEEVSLAVEEMVQEGWEHPTRFEIETAMAFLAFLKWECQIVLLEVGLGGREDATNVVEEVPVSVFTPISLDHTQILGDTVEKIAMEKAGIIKRGTRVVTVPQEESAMDVIRAVAKEKKVPVSVAFRENCRILSSGIGGSMFMYKEELYRTCMAGGYQVQNACLAIETCLCLADCFAVDKEAMRRGIRNAFWRGRFDVVNTEPVIVMDGAHNPAGAKCLKDAIMELLPERPVHAVMGVFKDKDYKEIISVMSEVVTDVIAITPEGERGLSKETLAETWKEMTDIGVAVADSVTEALEKAVANSRKGDAIVLFGSLSFFRQLKWKECGNDVEK